MEKSLTLTSWNTGGLSGILNQSFEKILNRLGSLPAHASDAIQNHGFVLILYIILYI